MLIFGLLVVSAFTLLELLTLHEAMNVKKVSAAAAALSNPPLMEIVPIGSCSGGYLSANLTVRGGVDRWLGVEVWSVSTRRIIASYVLHNGSALIRIPCNEGVVIVVRGERSVWQYSYDRDPLIPCLHGSIVRGYDILEKARSCLTAEMNSVQDTAALLHSAVTLVPLWVAAAPFYFNTTPLGLVSDGIVPGMNVYGRSIRLYPFKENIDDEYTLFFRAYRPYAHDVGAVWRHRIETIGNTLYLRHGDVYMDIEQDWVTDSNYEGAVRFGLLDYGFVRIDPLMKACCGTRFTEECCVGIPFADVSYSPIRYIAAGAAGSLYIPFLVTRDSARRVLYVMIADSMGQGRVVQYYYEKACMLSVNLGKAEKYNYTLAAPRLYASIVLHLFYVNGYNPSKLIVEPRYLDKLDKSWIPLIQVPVASIRVSRLVNLTGRADYFRVVIDPSILNKLGPNVEAGIVVLEVRYAAKPPSFAYPLEHSVDERGYTAISGVGFQQPVEIGLLLDVFDASSRVVGRNLVLPRTLSPEQYLGAAALGNFTSRTHVWSSTTIGCINGLYVERGMSIGAPPYLVFNVTTPATLIPRLMQPPRTIDLWVEDATFPPNILLSTGNSDDTNVVLR